MLLRVTLQAHLPTRMFSEMKLPNQRRRDFFDYDYRYPPI